MKKIALLITYRNVYGSPRYEITARIILDQKPHTLQDIEEEIRQYNNSHRNNPAPTEDIGEVVGISGGSSMKLDHIIDIPEETEHPFGDILDLILLPPTPEGVQEINKMLTFVASAAFSRGDVHGHHEAVMED